MKEDMLKGFVYDENGKLKISHDDLASIERIFGFLLKNITNLKDLESAVTKLADCLEKTLREKARDIHPEFNDVPNSNMPYLVICGFSNLNELERLMNQSKEARGD